MAVHRLGLISSSQEAGTHSTADKIIDIQILHKFWPHTTIQERGGYIANHVTVKNIGNVSLNNVQVYVDLDDDSPQFDARLVDRDGNPIDTNLAPALNFGNLSPGAEKTVPYWWTAVERFPGSQGSQTRIVTFNLYPIFTADFQQNGVSFSNKAKIDKA